MRSSDIEATGSGTYCGLSRARILQVAITQHLLKVGMSLSAAATAALQFSDTRGSKLFDFGKTLLIIDQTTTRVVNADFDISVTDASRRAPSAIIVDCNQIVAAVDAALA